ncbi:MAG: hypothetical protein HYU59_04900 [Magnetospirillum gryphiswaldense]|nr:hypothetical protein [Magnetospirillum gryphiswaldense]
MRIDSQPVCPISERPSDLPWDQDIVFIHWSDFAFPQNESCEEFLKSRGQKPDLSLVQAIDTERKTALDRLFEAVMSNPGKEGGVHWYVYSGDDGGAFCVVNAEENITKTYHVKIPQLSTCSWVTLTSKSLNPSAGSEEIIDWVNEVLERPDRKIKQFEQMFRLFLDAEIIARYAQDANLPEWLTAVVRSNPPHPDWKKFFSSAVEMAPQGAIKNWPFSLFPDDIQQLALANCDTNRQSWFEDKDEGFAEYLKRWKTRYLKNPS